MDLRPKFRVELPRTMCEIRGNYLPLKLRWSLTQTHTNTHSKCSGHNLKTIWVTELVHEPLGALSLLHDALLVVLADGAGKLVVVHGGAVLAFTPQPSYTHAVLNLEYSFLPVYPANAGAIGLRLLKESLQELPQVDVGATATSAGVPVATPVVLCLV